MEYYPPVKELKRSGDILFLKKKIADEALDLEMQVMNYSYALTKHIPEIHAALISDIMRCALPFPVPRRCRQSACPSALRKALPEIQT